MAKHRQRNERLLAVIHACGWSYEACAHAVRTVARENGADLPALRRSHVAHWVAGVRPSGLTPRLLAEAASRRLGWQVTTDDIGLGPVTPSAAGTPDLQWAHDPVADLVTVGRADMERREFAKTTLYSLAALAVPLGEWQEIADRGRYARGSGVAVGTGEVEAIRHMTASFSRADERFGGGHARLAIVAYLTTDVAGYLRGRFASDEDRRAMFSAAAELTYLAGWKAFDCSLHGLAQNYYTKALRLANEAGDGPLAGFILRAMAHQAVDLGHGPACRRLAESALEWSRRNATPGAAALFNVVKARGFAAEGHASETVRTLQQAEQLLGRVDRDAEPVWLNGAGGLNRDRGTVGLGEASLANQTANALRDLRDIAGAERQFKRSIAIRNGVGNPRIHALTLANLADIQFAGNRLTEACRTWSRALDVVKDVRSSRADQAVRNLRRCLATLGPRMPMQARQLDQRAARQLASSGAAARPVDRPGGTQP